MQTNSSDQVEAAAAALKSRYSTIIRQHISKDFKDIDVTVPPLHGDHFASSCDYVTIHQQDKEKELIELFVKRMVDNPNHTEMIKELCLFEKEAGFFNSLIPVLQRFIESKVKDSGKNSPYILDMIPRCFFADSEVVMVENLAKKGYILLNKVERQDLNQATTVMRTLAKFHGPSYLMLKEEKCLKLFLSKNPCLDDAMRKNGSNNQFRGWINSSFGIAETILKSHPSSDNDYAVSVIGQYKTDLMEKLQELLNLDHGNLCHVINHGDCWNNNMMFLLDERSGKILNHILVDFQVIRIGSPNLDISYYMYTSIKHDVRQAHWKNLLKIYYDALCENVKSLNGTVDFTFEDFLADYKKKFMMGFVFGVCMTGSFEAYGALGNLDNVRGDIMVYINDVITKWIERNPGKTEKLAQDLSSLFQDYKKLIED